MRSFLAGISFLLAAAMPACAQNYWVTPGGSTAPGEVDMCLNSSGQAVPASSGQCPNQQGSSTNPTISRAVGTNNFATSQATAATTSTLLCAARTGRQAATIENLGTAAVWIGNTGVTTTTGFEVPPTNGASVTIPTSAAIYGVVATGTQAVSCLESY